MYRSVLPVAVTTRANLCSKIVHSEDVSLLLGRYTHSMIEVLAARTLESASAPCMREGCHRSVAI